MKTEKCAENESAEIERGNTHMGRDVFLLGQPRRCICTNASRGLSATAEFPMARQPSIGYITSCGGRVSPVTEYIKEQYAEISRGQQTNRKTVSKTDVDYRPTKDWCK